MNLSQSRQIFRAVVAITPATTTRSEKKPTPINDFSDRPELAQALLR